MPTDPSTQLLKKELSDACQLIGSKIPFWTQGCGGNISIKSTTNKLFIKASGTRLDQVTQSTGIATLQLQNFVKGFDELQNNSIDNVEKAYANLITNTAVLDSSVGDAVRPSMESGFHALLPKHLVAHFHSLIAIWIADEVEKGNSTYLEILGDSAICLDPSLPGFELSKNIAQYPQYTYFILKNHGLVVQGDDINVLKDWQLVEQKYAQDHLSKLQQAFLTSNKMDWTLVPSAPFKLIFPDAVIFADRIKKIIKPVSRNANNFLLVENAESLDLDAAETWAACALLLDHKPLLHELPESISAKILGLPVEKLRLQFMKNNGASA